MKTSKRFEIICWTLAVLPLVATALCMPSLPAQIPLHWNLTGQIDGWGGRNSAWMMPFMTLAINAMFVFLPKIDPKRRSYENFGKAYSAFRLVFNLFMLFMCSIMLYSAYRPGALSIARILPAAVGALFCVLGNYMPKFKHNYFVGIKTPWTLASESVWHSTHRLGGVLWFFGGLVLIVSSFVSSGRIAETILFAVLIVMTVIPMAYSYLAFAKEEKNGKCEK